MCILVEEERQLSVFFSLFIPWPWNQEVGYCFGVVRLSVHPSVRISFLE
jgi:hypothetical protein